MNVALAIILNKEKVLIGKIKPEKVDEYGGLPYVFPCESVQDQSTAEEELVNEVKRQSGLDIKVIRKIGERIHPLTKNYSYYFHCEISPEQSITVLKDIDVESFVWTDIGELEKYMPTLFIDVKKFLDKNR